MKRQTQQAMFSLIEQCEQTGLSKREFCEQNNDAYTTFQYWFTKYNKAKIVPVENKPPGFIPLNFSTSNTSTGAAIEMIFPNGTRIVFHQGVQVDFLRGLMA